MKLDILRKKYLRFIYRNYSYRVSEGNLKISFLFEIPPDLSFRPIIIVNNVSRTLLAKNRLARNVLDNLVFHIGLMEMLSYWKSTCSTEIVIEAGYLNKKQIKWWRDLIIKGMGQFFYENKIDWRKPTFLRILTPGVKRETPGVVSPKLKNRYLVPFAGGRDSIVTAEKIKKRGEEMVCFMVNPTKISLAVHRTFRGLKKPIVVERTIDKKLFDLNKKGTFLNGHTPFTSLLSFISVLCAVLFDYKHIVFSLEKSANEGNVKYLGKIINHQWAKSSEFEKMFKDYCKKYLVKNINYFSYLRNYGELEISKMLTKYPKYFPVFSSCNKSSKSRWCKKCPKCLFVYLTLYPYLDKKQMIKIFGKDLFNNKKLLPTMKSLMGWGSHKPFECVGTYRESKKTALLSIEKAKKSGEIPYLLKRVGSDLGGQSLGI